MSYDNNPFPVADQDRHEIWEMLVRRDIQAFVTQDWSLVEDDFVAEGFFGLHAHNLGNPDGWRLAFPTLDVYRDEWLRQAATSAATEYDEPLGDALFRITHMRDIEIDGTRAVVHKKFDGRIRKRNGELEHLQWQTLYFCTKQDAHWKISSFVGYLPHPMKA